MNPVPRTGESEATERIRQKDALDRSIRGGQEQGPNPRTGSCGGAPGATDWNIPGKGRPPWTGTFGRATHPDWSVRGRSSPGQERPGQKKKEKQTAAEKNGEENKNKSKEQMGKDKKERRREVGGEREEGEAAKHMEPGWEQPAKQRNRSGSTGSGAALEFI